MAVQNKKTKRDTKQLTRVKYRTLRRIVYLFYKAFRKLRTIQTGKPNQRKVKAVIAFLFSFSLFFNLLFNCENKNIYIN